MGTDLLSLYQADQMVRVPSRSSPMSKIPYLKEINFRGISYEAVFAIGVIFSPDNLPCLASSAPPIAVLAAFLGIEFGQAPS